MEKKLPKMSIEGDTIEQLIKIEMILVMLGYDEPDEGWNNHVCDIDSSDKRPILEIYLSDYGKLTYFKWDCYHDLEPPRFKDSQLTEIIDYVTNYKG